MTQRAIIWGVLLLFSCNTPSPSGGDEPPAPTDSVAVVPATNLTEESLTQVVVPLETVPLPPMTLKGVRTTLDFNQYLPEAIQLDSVSVGMGLSASLGADRHTVEITITGDIGFLDVLHVFANGNQYDVLLKHPTLKEVTLRLRDKGYSKVALKGEMTNEEEIPMKKNRGIWEYTFSVPPGEYPYQFVVDGSLLDDPKNPGSVLRLPGATTEKQPQLRAGEITDNSLQLNLENGGVALAFWQNHQLKVKKQGQQVTIAVPESASSLDVSKMRVCAQNEFGFSEELEVTLQRGKLLPESLRSQ
jgi:hypothetical protein